MHRPHKAGKRLDKTFSLNQQFKAIRDIRRNSHLANFFFFIALCFEQTSPLGVPMYAFGAHPYGFSLSNLHYFPSIPKKAVAKYFCYSTFLLSFKINSYFPSAPKRISLFHFVYFCHGEIGQTRSISDSR